MKRVVLTSIAITVVLTSTVVAKFNFDKVPKKLPAYYLAGIQRIDTIKTKLTAQGFEVISTDKILSGKTVITITNQELKATNSYMATLHILVNRDASEVRVQNPSYLASAYLKNYHYGDFKKTLTGLENALSRMIPMMEAKNIATLSDYHFMFGMPYLNDTITVSRETILPQKSISYSLKLPNGTILVGHKLSSKTTSFLKKIGQSNNAQLLPYESMIKGGRATILDPKYYLPLSLPSLSMGKFMKIATTPDSIEKEIQRAYK
jgi:hypothetical protein